MLVVNSNSNHIGEITLAAIKAAPPITVTGMIIFGYTGQEASRIYLVPTNTALDAVNGYPLAASAPVNSRSSVMVQRQNNGVHPDTSGYQQIGDALWAFLKCNA